MQCNRPEMAVDYLARYGNNQNPSCHVHDAVHFALALHLYGNFKLPDAASSRVPEDSALGSLLSRTPAGRDTYDLGTLLKRWGLSFACVVGQCTNGRFVVVGGYMCFAVVVAVAVVVVSWVFVVSE